MNLIDQVWNEAKRPKSDAERERIMEDVRRCVEYKKQKKREAQKNDAKA